MADLQIVFTSVHMKLVMYFYFSQTILKLFFLLLQHKLFRKYFSTLYLVAILLINITLLQIAIIKTRSIF